MTNNQVEPNHPCQALRRFDNGRCSIIHAIFNYPPDQPKNFSKQYLIPYIATAILTYGVIFIILAATHPSNISQSLTVDVPFLFDLNVAWMFLVSLPSAIVYLVTERWLVPNGISNIYNDKVLIIDEGEATQLINKWGKKYCQINIILLILGIFVGVIVAAANYSIILQSPYTSWLTFNGSISSAGWYYLVCIAIFYLIATIVVGRICTTIFFLRDLVKHSSIRIIPLHPDKCVGLNPVGQIGLRNQYLLSIIGIKIIILIGT